MNTNAILLVNYLKEQLAVCNLLKTRCHDRLSFLVNNKDEKLFAHVSSAKFDRNSKIYSGETEIWETAGSLTFYQEGHKRPFKQNEFSFFFLIL